MAFRSGHFRLFGEHHRSAMIMVAVALAVGCALAAYQAHAEHQWRQAKRLLLRREFDLATPCIASCLGRWPENPDVHLLAARLARLRKQSNELFEHLEQARKLNGNAEQIVLERYLLRAERGELADVEKKLLVFLYKEHPDRPFVYDTLTFQWMMMHRFGDALPALDDWHRLQPELTEPIIRRAWILEKLPDFPAAIAAYQQALELDPEKDRREGDRVRLRHAELLLARFRYDEALAGFEILAHRQPDHPEIMLGLARCRLALGQSAEGIGLLQQLLTQAPNHGKALAELGRALLQQQRWDEASEHLAKALESQPFDKTIVHSLHQCMLKLGAADKANQLQTRLDRLIADERTMARLMEGVRHAPQDPVLRQQIGEVFLRNRMEEEGLLWLRSSVNLDPNFAPAREALAEWWESRGEAAKAAPHREALAGMGVPKKPSNRFAELK